MTDFFFQMGLSNACLSLALGIVAMVVGAKARRPHLAYMLWLLVFIKLLTPPIVMIPIVTIPAQGETAVAINEISRAEPLLSNSSELNIETSPWSKLVSAMCSHTRAWLPPIWLLGSVVVFAFSIVRVCRFSRMLAAKSEVAPQQLQTAAAKMARRLGLNRIPTILATSARISPMVWWAGGKVRIVIPNALLNQMDAQQWKWILAHELAHVRRRDYLVRWLEWLACICFWWNPVVWWAQRNLRAAEEICCDELVISCLNPKPKSYANSLLSAVEFLAGPVFRPPAMASEINSGGFLERRFKMIVSNKPQQSNTRWLQVCVLLCAVVVLPLGIASAADYEAVGRRLRAAVAAGELTGEEARAMLGALRKVGEAKDKKDIDYEAVGRRIRAAVAAGEMTEEQGRERLAAFRRRMEMAERGKRGERRITREDYARTEAELDKAIAAGRISEEDAKARLNEMRRIMAGQSERGQRSITIEEYKRAETKMRKMIEDGKAKSEDVERRLIEMRKMIGDRSERGERSITVEEYRRAEAKMRKMIEDGKAKPEDVERRLIEMRKMIGDQSDGGEGRISREDAGKRGVNWEGIKRRIEGAVKSGDMTREEADAKYKEIREGMAKRRGR